MFFRFLFVVLLCSVLPSVVDAGSYDDIVNLKPLHYASKSFSNINVFSLTAHDLHGNTVTAYLNKGDVDYYDEDSSFIDCEDVIECNTGYVFLEDGTYTLFIVNDFYVTSQKVTYDAHFWSPESEIVIFPLLVGLFVSSCIILYCIYRSCCRVTGTEKVTVVYDSKSKSFAPYTEVSGEGMKGNEDLVPVTIELIAL